MEARLGHIREDGEFTEDGVVRNQSCVLYQAFRPFLDCPCKELQWVDIGETGELTCSRFVQYASYLCTRTFATFSVLQVLALAVLQCKRANFGVHAY